MALALCRATLPASFPAVAQALGTGQACRNASGGNASSQNPGRHGAGPDRGYDPSLVDERQRRQPDARQPEATRRLVADHSNQRLQRRSGHRPGESSDSAQLRDKGLLRRFKPMVRRPTGSRPRMYKDYIQQTFYNTSTCAYDTGYAFFDKPGGSRWTAYLHGDSWVPPHPHPPWNLIDAHPGNNKYKRDTVVTKKHVMRRNGPQSVQVELPSVGNRRLDSAASQALCEQTGTMWTHPRPMPTDFYTGAESTSGNQGTGSGRAASVRAPTLRRVLCLATGRQPVPASV